MSASQRECAALILAAGRGTRMKSDTPKVLHDLCGRPLLGYPLAAVEALSPARTIAVIAPGADAVRERFGGRVELVVQEQPRGTGDAVLSAREALAGFHGDILILYGDVPLLRGETLREMAALRARTDADLVLLTSPEPLPGRVVRDAGGRVQRIVEVTDASPEELAIREGNTGTYLLRAELLWKALARVGADNAQGEVYLTDLVASAVSEGLRVEALQLEDPEESLGVNTRAELARAAAALRRRIAERHMAAGVTLVDPDHTYIDMDVEIGRDTRIEPGCTIQGPTRIGERVHLKPGCMLESCVLEEDVVVGPSAHLRPGTRLGRGVRIGNFVEVKNSTLGAGTKADHLSYIGDADVGPGASFGCGSITVNYDGVAKHRTTVGEGAFIGCNANLIAPVTLERNAYVAAGSTVTQDVPADALAVGRSQQRNVEGWRRRRRPRAGNPEK